MVFSLNIKQLEVAIVLRDLEMNVWFCYTIVSDFPHILVIDAEEMSSFYSGSNL